MTIMDDQSAAKGGRTSRPRASPLDGDRLASQYGWVRSVAYNLVRDPVGAEDVTQETLLAALAAPPRDVPDDQRLRAWLGRVAFNLSRLSARQGARRRAREQRVARKESLPSVSEALEASGTIEALSAAIAGLDEPYRGVVLMRYFDELSTAEIAARTNTSELAVRKRLWRARNKLRDSIDHDPETGRILAALLSMKLATRGWRELSLAGLAAAVVVGTGAVWWSGLAERAEESALRAAPQYASARSALAAGHALPADEPARPPADPRAPSPGESGPGPRREETRGNPAPPRAPEARVTFLDGYVIDLMNQPRGGLELFAPDAPEEVLATSDAAGAFRIPRQGSRGQEAELTLAARGEGWTTVVPARPRDARVPKSPVVVAPAADLEGQVLDEQGRSVPSAHFEVHCEEFTFEHLDFPVRLDSALLGTFVADAAGVCHATALPRADGIVLRIHAPGFEPLERSTATLGRTSVFVLAALPAERFLTGSVSHANGRPAVGASVTLAQGHTTTDAYGRFRLPVRGVSPHSSLEAEDADKSAGPAQVPDFGARLRMALDEELELVLGEENDQVEGKLVGDESEGWLVAAYLAAGTPLDESGQEPPVALTRSDSEGRFAFSLPRGLYDLYAVSPGTPRVVQRTAVGSQWRDWPLDVPAASGFRASSGTLVADDGVPLDRAALQIHVRLDGPQGHRRLSTTELTSDERGAFLLEHAADLEFELEVTHPALGRQAFTLASVVEGADGSVARHERLPRPAFVRISEAPAEQCAFLDAEGAALLAHGPLHSARAFSLRSGASAVLEVPADARWIRLESEDREPWIEPIEARPGQVLDLRR